MGMPGMVVAHYKKGAYLPLTETFIYNQVMGLRRYRPVVFCHSTENEENFPGGDIRSLRLGGEYGLRSVAGEILFRALGFHPSFFFHMREIKPELVHAHFGQSGYSFLGLKRRFGLPMVTSFYGYDISRLLVRKPEWRKRYRELFRTGDAFLVEGEKMKNTLIELGCPEEKAHIQHLGIDLEAIDFRPRRMGEDGETRILISAGFREKKGIPYAVEAFGRLRGRRPGLKLRLTILGDSDGSRDQEAEKKKILAGIEEYGVGESVDMLGFRPYSVHLNELGKHHIFLSPSVVSAEGDTEGGVPMAIIEATASGMPVVSTRHCDIPEAIIDGENGLLAPERDAEALCEKLEFLVDNPERWEEMGRWGREHTEKNYDLAKQSERLEAIYDGLVAG